MARCASCSPTGFCWHRQTRAVTARDLTPDFVLDMRAYAFELGISPGRAWLEFVTDAYRDAPLIVDEQGDEVVLDLEQFETVDRYWWRDQLKPKREGAKPRVKAEARERLVVLASILRARDPQGTAMWGVRAANENAPSGVTYEAARELLSRQQLRIVHELIDAE